MAAKRTRQTALKALKQQLAISVDDLALVFETDRKAVYDEVKAEKKVPGTGIPHFTVGRLIRIPSAWVLQKLGIKSAAAQK
jgi:hypothetical protein